QAAGHDLRRVVDDVCSALADEGHLDANRRDGYVVPVYERSVEELRRPFEQEVGRRVHLEQLTTPPCAESDRRAVPRRRGRRDLRGEFTAFFRAWSEPTLREVLALERMSSTSCTGV
ncbi:MAG TPA: hypothetical protein VK923_01350, partial [Euzebyales bacterium]|nr:hypothetical protein [Euzebyales bacterium]